MIFSEELHDFIIKYAKVVDRKPNNRKLCFGFHSKWTKTGTICEGIREGLFDIDTKLYDNDNQFAIILTEHGVEMFQSINELRNL